MIQQLEDQNRRLATQMAVMNRENRIRENEADSHYNNDGPVGGEEENNIHETHRREETNQTTTMQDPPIYFGPFSEFIVNSPSRKLPAAEHIEAV